MEFHHTSVLLNETIDNLNIRPDGIYVDGTLGGGGHALEVAKRLGEGGRLIGIDQDADAILAATERLKEYQDRVTIVRSNYCNMRQELKNLGIEKVDGIVLDLGVSSFQLDTPKRGFTYMEENAPLDMRMDQRESRTARDIVNTYSEKELYRIIRGIWRQKKSNVRGYCNLNRWSGHFRRVRLRVKRYNFRYAWTCKIHQSSEREHSHRRW